MRKVTKEDMKYRQGRSKEQWESNEITTMVAFCGLVLVLLYVVIKNIF
jgi:hypothetical protein